MTQPASTADCKTALVDRFGRVVKSLRLSVTDRCNLRCVYCMPEGPIRWFPKSRILSFEELTRLASILAGLGVRDLRLTGGEPLLRRDLPILAGMLARVEGIEELALTTNGLLLDDLAAPLVEAGVRRFNIHLDALTAGAFRAVSRRDGVGRILAGIAAVERLGATPIKINAVVVRGLNEDAILPLAGLAVQHPYHVRFIELMPLGGGEPFEVEKLVPGHEIRARIESSHRLTPIGRDRPSSPATVFRIDGGAGNIGFINPVTEPFCGDCDRIRLTADGKVRTCLFARTETDLAGPLRAGAPDRAIADLLRAAVAGKEAGGCLELQHFYEDRLPRKMWQIGG